MDKTHLAFINFMEKQKVCSSKKALVAVSGGADSVCALLLTNGYFDEVIAVHVNYGLRGEESDSEQKYVENLCSYLGVTLHIKNVTPEEKTGGNQSAYRDLRYSWFAEIYKQEQCDYLVVGHHKNDQAETVFMNMVKGAGVVGLAGMKPVSENFGMKILRPLLGISKTEIISFLNYSNTEFKTDSSNLKNDYTRNKLRNKIFPEIESSMHADVTESLSKLSQQMNDIMNMFSMYNEQINTLYVEDREDSFVMNFAGIQETYHYAILKQFIYSFLTDKLGIKPVQSIHVDDVIKLFSLENGSMIHLPYWNLVTKKESNLVFQKFNPAESYIYPNFKKKLPLGEEVKLEQVGYVVKVMQGHTEQEVEGEECIHLYLQDENQPLYVKSYEEGSKIRYKSDGHKKIKKLMKEKSGIQLYDTWYIKSGDEPIYIPHIQFAAFCEDKDKKITLHLKPLTI